MKKFVSAEIEVIRFDENVVAARSGCLGPGTGTNCSCVGCYSGVGCNGGVGCTPDD